MALMEPLEVMAREKGLSVLVLDTSTGSGVESFYQRAGWHKVGGDPALCLDARWCDDGDIRFL